MKNKNGKVAADPGSKSDKEVSLEEIKKFLQNDLTACINMLRSIQEDKATLDQLAVFMHGRYLNWKHQAELDNQLTIDDLKSMR